MFSDRTHNGSRCVRHPAVIGILLVLAACGDESSKMTPPGEAPQTGAAGEPPVPVLANSAWQVLRIDGEAVLEDAVPSLTFDAESRVAGSSGCNRFFGAFSVERESLSFGPLGSTMMACPDALMRQERRLFEALEAVARMADGRDGKLLLLDSTGAERVSLQPQPAASG